MTTADKLTRLKTDFDEVYNAGYENGKAEGNTDLLQYATFINGGLFRTAVFPDDLDVYFKIGGHQTKGFTVSCSNVFAYSNAKNITLEVEKTPELGIDLNHTFAGCLSLLSVTFKSTPFRCGVLNSCFLDASKLETINGELDLSLTMNINNTFNKCYALKEIRFVKNSIKKSLSFSDSADLTDNSVQSIVDGLADSTGQTAPVLTAHPTVKARIVADDAKEDTDPTKRFWLRTLTSKNWTLA